MKYSNLIADSTQTPPKHFLVWSCYSMFSLAAIREHVRTSILLAIFSGTSFNKKGYNRCFLFLVCGESLDPRNVSSIGLGLFRVLYIEWNLMEWSAWRTNLGWGERVLLIFRLDFWLVMLFLVFGHRQGVGGKLAGNSSLYALDAQCHIIEALVSWSLPLRQQCLYSHIQCRERGGGVVAC